MTKADKEAAPRGAKRAPPDIEHLLCAMLQLRPLPSGVADWTKVAARIPDKEGGEKHNQEAVRGSWRRLKRKWEDEGLWPEYDSDEEKEKATTSKEPKALKATKAKGKGRAKVKAPPKVKKTGKDAAGGGSDEEHDSAGEGPEKREGSEEESDAGIKAAVKEKSKAASRATENSDNGEEEDGDDGEA